MSFRERSAWIALATYGVVFGTYFFVLGRAWDDAYSQGFGLLVGAVVCLVIIATTLTILSAMLNPKQANALPDERETLIDLKAERLASYALSACVICLIGALLMGWSGFLVANLLLASMVIAELVKALAQIVSYRRGA